MDAEEKALAEAAENLSPEDMRYLQENDMLPESGAESAQTGPEQVAGSEERKRRKVEHQWPEVGTILEADYKGEHYQAEVIRMPRYKNGKAVRILNGPASGEVESSMSGAMLTATEKQREENDLGRSGVANGWEFWEVKEEPGQE